MKALKLNWITVISILVIFAICLPMLYFFRFSVLGGDDFLYGRETLHAIEDTGSYFNAIKIALKNTADTYMNWQGSFFTVFLMYLHPGIISLAFYRIVLAGIFILGVVAPCIAAFTVNKHYLCAPPKYIWAILASYIFVSTQYMPSIYQAYYWFNGVIYYQFTLSIAFLFVAAFIKYRFVNSKNVKILLLISLFLMVFMIAGSNFPIGLVFTVALATYITIAHIKKYESRKIDTIIFTVFLIIFLANVLAPGNRARQGSYTFSTNMVSAAIASVRDMSIETPKWITSTIMLGIICSFIPLANKITQNAKFRFVHPLIAGALFILFMLAQYFPVEYGLGSKGPERVENIRFMLFNIGLWLFFINLFGYLKNHEKPVSKLIAAILATALISYPLSSAGINTFTSYKMADQIAYGELKEFAIIIGLEIAQLEDKNNDYPVDYSEHITNEFLHPDTTFWFDSGIWSYYRKSPKRE